MSCVTLTPDGEGLALCGIDSIVIERKDHYKALILNFKDGTSMQLHPEQVPDIAYYRLHCVESLFSFLKGRELVTMRRGKNNEWVFKAGLQYRVVHWYRVMEDKPFPYEKRAKLQAPVITWGDLQPETQEPEEENMIEKNLAALIRKDTVTVNVKLCEAGAKSGSPLVTSDEKSYTFVATDELGLKVDDYVVVKTSQGLKVAKIESVDAELAVQPGSTTKYQWVVSKLDMTYFDKLQSDNDAIVEKVAELQRRNMQRSFREQIIGGLSEAELLALPAAAR